MFLLTILFLLLPSRLPLIYSARIPCRSWFTRLWAQHVTRRWQTVTVSALCSTLSIGWYKYCWAVVTVQCASWRSVESWAEWSTLLLSRHASLAVWHPRLRCHQTNISTAPQISNYTHLIDTYILRYMLQVVWRKLTKSLPLNQINVQQLEPIFSELTHFTMKYNRISQNLFKFHLPAAL